jgi:hypothetical protein
MTPGRVQHHIIRSDYSSPLHLTSEMSSLAKIFYNKMKTSDEKKRKQESRTEPHDVIPESELVCVAADICAICCETDAIPDLFRTICGHLFHKNCLQRWCDHTDTCPNCRVENPFGYAQSTPYHNTRRTLNFGVNAGFIEEVRRNQIITGARQEVNEFIYNNIINNINNYYNENNNNIDREYNQINNIVNNIIQD